jgi:hypothetical protein
MAGLDRKFVLVHTAEGWARSRQLRMFRTGSLAKTSERAGLDGNGPTYLARDSHGALVPVIGVLGVLGAGENFLYVFKGARSAPRRLGAAHAEAPREDGSCRTRRIDCRNRLSYLGTLARSRSPGLPLLVSV